MPSQTEQMERQDHSEGGGFIPLIGRLTWIILGPLGLAILAFRIGRTGHGWLTGTDLVYGIVVVLMIAGRWIEMRCGNAMTAQGEPATSRHLKRYIVFLLIIGLAVWTLANYMGNHALQ